MGHRALTSFTGEKANECDGELGAAAGRWALGAGRRQRRSSAERWLSAGCWMQGAGQQGAGWRQQGAGHCAMAALGGARRWCCALVWQRRLSAAAGQRRPSVERGQGGGGAAGRQRWATAALGGSRSWAAVAVLGRARRGEAELLSGGVPCWALGRTRIGGDARRRNKGAVGAEQLGGGLGAGRSAAQRWAATAALDGGTLGGGARGGRQRRRAAERGLQEREGWGGRRRVEMRASSVLTRHRRC